MKFTWGTGILLAILAFMGFIMYFFVITLVDKIRSRAGYRKLLCSGTGLSERYRYRETNLGDTNASGTHPYTWR